MADVTLHTEKSSSRCTGSGPSFFRRFLGTDDEDDWEISPSTAVSDIAKVFATSNDRELWYPSMLWGPFVLLLTSASSDDNSIMLVSADSITVALGGTAGTLGRDLMRAMVVMGGFELPDFEDSAAFVSPPPPPPRTTPLLDGRPDFAFVPALFVDASCESNEGCELVEEPSIRVGLAFSFVVDDGVCTAAVAVACVRSFTGDMLLRVVVTGSVGDCCSELIASLEVTTSAVTVFPLCCGLCWFVAHCECDSVGCMGEALAVAGNACFMSSRITASAGFLISAIFCFNHSRSTHGDAQSSVESRPTPGVTVDICCCFAGSIV